MFPSPEGKTALEIGHLSKFSIDNFQFSWHFHFHNRLPHLCQAAELLIPPPTFSYLHLLPAKLPSHFPCCASSSDIFANLSKTLTWQKTSSLNTHVAKPSCFGASVAWGAAAWAGQG